MRRIVEVLTLLGVSAAAIVVLTTGLADQGGTATAAPPAVPGLSSRIVTTEVTVAAETVQAIEATCDSSELLTGGGYQVASIGPNDKVFINAPLDDLTWLVELYNGTDFEVEAWAYAICLSRGR